MSRYLHANHETYQANYKLLVSGNYFHNRFKKYFRALTGLFIFPSGSAILPYLQYCLCKPLHSQHLFPSAGQETKFIFLKNRKTKMSEGQKTFCTHKAGLICAVGEIAYVSYCC